MFYASLTCYSPANVHNREWDLMKIEYLCNNYQQNAYKKKHMHQALVIF